MKISKFKLERFKKFRDFDLELKSGINVIKGVNEAGKSTLLEGLVVALFFSPNQKMDRYKTWHEQQNSSLELEFTAADQVFILRKDFEEGKVSLGYRSGGKDKATIKSVKESLSRLLGLDSDEAFLATACVRQHEMDMIAGSKMPFRLEQILLGSPQDITTIIKRLDKAINEIEKGLTRPVKDPGLFIQFKKRLGAAEEYYQEIKTKLTKKNEYQEGIKKLEGDLETINKQKEIKTTLFEKNQRNYKLYEEQKKLKNQYEVLYQKRHQIESLSEKENKLAEEISKINVFKDSQQADGMLNNVLRLEGKLENFQGQKQIINNKYFVLGIIAVSFIGVGIALYLRSSWIWGALAILWLGIGFIKYTIKRKGDLVTDQLQKIMGGIKGVTISQFRKIYNQYRELNRKKEAIKNQLQGIVGNQSLAEITQEEAAIARKLAVIEQQIESSTTKIKLQPEEYLKLEDELQIIEKQMGKLTNQITEYRTHSKDISVSHEDLVCASEEIASLESELERIESRYKAYLLTRKKIEEARICVLEEAAQEFHTNIADYLSRFTKGRYQKIRTDIGKNGLSFQVYSSEKEQWIEPEELSSGTQDQIYLASRLRLLQLVAGQSKPPLILDDPFSNFDNIRLAEVMDVCCQIAKEYQIILFTCTDRYDIYANNIIMLDGNKKPRLREKSVKLGDIAEKL